MYAAATRYKIAGLAELAQDAIVRSGQELSILDVLGVARDHAFPILPDEEAWFAGYLEEAIKRAAARDPGLFVQEGFVEQIEGDRRFRQVVMRAIVGTYAAAGGGGGGGDQPPMEGPGAGEGSRDKAGQGEEAPVATGINADGEDVVQLDDIEPSMPESPVHRAASPGSPAAPESVTDELDFKSSKTYQSMGKPAEHVRHDSVVVKDVVQAEDVADVADGQEDESGTKEEEIASPAAEVIIANGTISAGKKNKNKKKKKNGTTF